MRERAKSNVCSWLIRQRRCCTMYCAIRLPVWWILVKPWCSLRQRKPRTVTVVPVGRLYMAHDFTKVVNCWAQVGAGDVCSRAVRGTALWPP